jgi:hypothetical protein
MKHLEIGGSYGEGALLDEHSLKTEIVFTKSELTNIGHRLSHS